MQNVKFLWNRVIAKNRTRLLNDVIRSTSLWGNGPNNKNSNNGNRSGRRFWSTMLIGTSVASLVAYKVYDYRKNLALAAELPADLKNAGMPKKGLPTYSLSEVAKHTTKEKRIWMTYKQGVYDVTDYVVEHPGLDQILLAAGTSVEPFWKVMAVHYHAHSLRTMEKMRIGNLSKEDADKLADNSPDPFENEPKRDPRVRAVSDKPYVGEPELRLLMQGPITPAELFYVRSHLPVPHKDPKSYQIEVEVEGEGKNIVLTLDEIKRMPKVTITATLMCSGNRRIEMDKVRPVNGLNWGPGGVGNATWTGVRLTDILEMAGVCEDNKKFKHVQFEGYDVDTRGIPYGASVRFAKAMDPKNDILVCYEMNGAPLTLDHGFPLRMVIPGVAGARSVKWLSKIIVSEHESEAFWQKTDYKGFNPNTNWYNVEWEKSPAVQELPINSAILIPLNCESVPVKDGHITAKGYAWSGNGQKIIRVDVTTDGGENWQIADIDYQDSADSPHHWQWTMWSAKLPVKPGAKYAEIWVKAVDSCYNTQPETFRNIYNFRGVLNNAYHRVKVRLQH